MENRTTVTKEDLRKGFTELGIKPGMKIVVHSSLSRFGYVEEQAIKAGTRPEEMTLEEMDKLWDDAKRMEK